MPTSKSKSGSNVPANPKATQHKTQRNNHSGKFSSRSFPIGQRKPGNAGGSNQGNKKGE